VRLIIGQDIRATLVPVTETHYAAEAIGPLFSELESKSRPLCTYRHALAPIDRAAIGEFVTPVSSFTNRGNGPRWNLIAGCWNYIRMNDRKPHRDFELVRARHPKGQVFDCYSVGVAQPYIMSEVLACEHLTMVDLDWRVHSVHWQLIQAWEQGRLAGDLQAAALAEMRTDWIAHLGASESQELSLATLCHPGIAERCGESLDAFSARRDRGPAIAELTLALSGLHEIPMLPAREGEQVAVIFLSNATERHFLKEEEFQAMLARVRGGLLPGQRAIFIHHVGGRAEFGLYEMLGTDEGHELRTICRDPYERVMRDSRTQPYETWFERAIREPRRGVPECRRLVREAPPADPKP
jgi:hypothetical protein